MEDIVVTSTYGTNSNSLSLAERNLDSAKRSRATDKEPSSDGCCAHKRIKTGIEVEDNGTHNSTPNRTAFDISYDSHEEECKVVTAAVERRTSLPKSAMALVLEYCASEELDENQWELSLDGKIAVDKAFAQRYRCVMCLQVYWDNPVTHYAEECCNTFCRKCVVEQLKVKNECPLCRKDLRKMHFSASIQVRNALNEQSVQCINCGSVMRKEQYEKHEQQQCPMQCKHQCFKQEGFFSNRSASSGGPFFGTKALEEHYTKTCPCELHKCINECSFRGYLHELKQHQCLYQERQRLFEQLSQITSEITKLSEKIDEERRQTANKVASDHFHVNAKADCYIGGLWWQVRILDIREADRSHAFSTAAYIVRGLYCDPDVAENKHKVSLSQLAPLRLHTVSNAFESQRQHNLELWRSSHSFEEEYALRGFSLYQTYDGEFDAYESSFDASLLPEINSSPMNNNSNNDNNISILNNNNSANNNNNPSPAFTTTTTTTTTTLATASSSSRSANSSFEVGDMVEILCYTDGNGNGTNPNLNVNWWKNGKVLEKSDRQGQCLYKIDHHTSSGQIVYRYAWDLRPSGTFTNEFGNNLWRCGDEVEVNLGTNGVERAKVKQRKEGTYNEWTVTLLGNGHSSFRDNLRDVEASNILPVVPLSVFGGARALVSQRHVPPSNALPNMARVAECIGTLLPTELQATVLTPRSLVDACDSYGKWYLAEVLDEVTSSVYRIHFLGWSTRNDESVPRVRLAVAGTFTNFCNKDEMQHMYRSPMS
jgi:hypothetical protein